MKSARETRTYEDEEAFRVDSQNMATSGYRIASEERNTGLITVEYRLTSSQTAAPTPLAQARVPDTRSAVPRPVAAQAYGQNVRYDASVINGFANYLYTYATVVTVMYTVVGLGVGTVLGAIRFLDDAALNFIANALLGSVVGYVFGTGRANALRLEAQLALCQVAIEESTRRSVTQVS